MVAMVAKARLATLDANVIGLANDRGYVRNSAEIAAETITYVYRLASHSNLR